LGPSRQKQTRAGHFGLPSRSAFATDQVRRLVSGPFSCSRDVSTPRCETRSRDVDEEGSGEVRQLLDAAEAVATSAVAYAEARAAFARLTRERQLAAAAHRRVRAALDADWERYVVVQVTEALCRRAGDLAERRALRGFDAVHLASYLALAEGTTVEVTFSSSDRALNRAATYERRRRPR
jgi:predicted nucleic acid-binding protein